MSFPVLSRYSVNFPVVIVYNEYMHIFLILPKHPSSKQKKMRPYKPGEVNRSALASLARQTFGCEPFGWQIETAIAILEGRDVVLDVGTGSGKTLAFSLASVMNKEEIIVIVSPLSSLMIEQMENAPISTVAICRETFSRVPKDELYRVS